MEKHIGIVDVINYQEKSLLLLGEHGNTTSRRYYFGLTLIEKVRELWGKRVEIVVTGSSAIGDIIFKGK
jgi:hypothetical protein